VTDAYGWQDFDENNDDASIRLKKVPENTMVFEITGPIFFGASTKIADVIRRVNKQVLVLRMRSVPAIDATGIHSFETIIKLCKKQNKTLILSHVNEQPMKTLEKAGLLEDILLADNIDTALEMAEKRK
jgi:SulP family sulfate permease